MAICYHCHYKILFYKSCVFVLYNLILSNFFGNLVSQSLITKNIYFRPITAISTFLWVGICTLTLRSAAPPSGGPPPSTSNGGRDLGLNSCYMIMCSVSVCQCVHNLRSISLDYPGQALLPNWLTKFSKPLSSTRREYITPLVRVLYAVQLTMLLAHFSLFIFQVRNVVV